METKFTIRTNKRKRQITLTIDGSKYRTLYLNKQEFANLQYLTYSDWKSYIRHSGNIVAL